MLKVGLKGTYTINVEDTHTAKAMKSGELEVFATPALCACMEAAAVECVRGHIDDGYSTVGSAIEINHIAPSVVGSSITAEAELVEGDAKKLVFKRRNRSRHPHALYSKQGEIYVKSYYQE